MTSTNKPSNSLSVGDRRKLAGFYDIVYPEPAQIFGTEGVLDEEEDKPTASKRLEEVYNLAEEVSSKIESLKQQVDGRCGHFKVVGKEGVGSRLFQAMCRVFGERTETVTYSHYKRALEMRQKLAEEQADILRSS